MNDNKVKLFQMTDKLGITPKLKSEDKELTGKPLMKRVMQAWLPAHEVRDIVHMANSIYLLLWRLCVEYMQMSPPQSLGRISAAFFAALPSIVEVRTW